MNKIKVVFSKNAYKKLLRLDRGNREKIYKAMYDLPDGDVKKLKGKKDPPFFRLRLGKLRIIFIKDESTKELFVFEIDYRGDVYKKI